MMQNDIRGAMKKLLMGIAVGFVVIAAAIIVAVFSGSNVCAGENHTVTLELTYPAGESPKIFTNGWVFGARCTLKSSTGKVEDISGQVRWDGTGAFKPAVGIQSRPVFQKTGKNTIKLMVIVDGKEITKDFTVDAVSPDNYAHVGDFGDCPADTHPGPYGPQHVRGPILTGSPNVIIDGKPAARVGDTGTHVYLVCIGANKFEIIEGDNSVLINGRPAARIGDKTRHCGGIGRIVQADAKPSSSSYSLDGDWYFIITKHKNNSVTNATKPGLKSSSYSSDVPDEKSKRTIRQQGNSAKIGSDTFDIESLAGKEFVLKRMMNANNSRTTFEYKGTFSGDNSWNGMFTREVSFEGPGYTIKETEAYHIEAWRLATYKGNVPQPIKENVTRFGL
jgi:uncharacterized Zn-binding protein involved in type VI secretion